MGILYILESCSNLDALTIHSQNVWFSLKTQAVYVLRQKNRPKPSYFTVGMRSLGWNTVFCFPKILHIFVPNVFPLTNTLCHLCFKPFRWSFLLPLILESGFADYRHTLILYALWWTHEHGYLPKHRNSAVKSSFLQLRFLSKVKSYLTFSDFKSIIYAFISTSFDYSNTLYIGVSQASLSRLQLVQNAADRLIT